VLDRDDPGDARWLLCTVESPADVRPASPGDDAPDDVTVRWVAARHGAPVTLTEMGRAVVWRIDGH
jgi:hypothetical protein